MSGPPPFAPSLRPGAPLTALAAATAVLCAPGLAAGSGPPPSPYGVFWGDGRTYLVDTAAGTLFDAPGLVTVTPEGALVRLRSRAEAFRPGARAAGLPAPASRRTVWEQVRSPERRWHPAGPAPDPWPAPGEALVDEHALLQFDGDRLTTLHLQRLLARDGGRRTVVEGRAFSVTGAPQPGTPPGAGAALSWVAAHVPFVFDPCLTRPAGRLPLHGPGGAERGYLLAAGAEPACADRVQALPLRATPTSGAAGPADLPPGVIDRRPLPGGMGTLDLVGEAPPEPRATEDPLALADPCVAFPVRLARNGLPPTEIGAAPALDGLTWLDERSPWLPWLGHVFAPTTACGLPLELLPAGQTPVRADGDVAEWPHDALEPGTALCRLVEAGRAWAGPTDLSAAAAAHRAGGDLVIAVLVRDVEPSPRDVVRVLTETGDLFVDRDGRLEANDLPGARAFAQQRASGWAVEIRLPGAAAGRGALPAVAVAVDDADPADPAGAGVRLWVAGEPAGPGGGRPLPLHDVSGVLP